MKKFHPKVRKHGEGPSRGLLRDYEPSYETFSSTTRHRHQGTTGHLQFLQGRLHFLRINATQTSARDCSLSVAYDMNPFTKQLVLKIKKKMKKKYSLYIAST